MRTELTTSTAPLTPEEVDVGLAVSWTRLLGFSPVSKTVPVYGGTDGYDEKFGGFEIPFGANHASIAALVELIDTACQKADKNMIAMELGRIKIGTVGRAMEGIDIEAWLLVVGEELERYPADVVKTACRRWIRREKWTPSVAEIVAECDRLMKRRNAMKAALRRAGEPPPAPKWDQPRIEYTPEQIAEARATVATSPAKPPRFTPKSLRRVREETDAMRAKADARDKSPQAEGG